MTPLTELLVQPDMRDVDVLVVGANPGAEAQHIRIVMLTALAGAFKVVNDGGAHLGNLVGGNAHADSGAADQDAAVAVAVLHQCADELRVVDIVNRRGGRIRSKVEAAITGLA